MIGQSRHQRVPYAQGGDFARCRTGAGASRPSSAYAGEWTPPLVIPRRGIRGDNGQPFRRVVQGEADDERRTDSQRAPTA
jgi:hypothetical protein